MNNLKSYESFNNAFEMILLGAAAGFMWYKFLKGFMASRDLSRNKKYLLNGILKDIETSEKIGITEYDDRFFIRMETISKNFIDIRVFKKTKELLLDNVPKIEMSDKQYLNFLEILKIKK